MTDYEDMQFSITPDDLDNQTEQIIKKLSTHITNEVKNSENEIISLQSKMFEKEKAIEELLIVRKNTKNVYYVGLFTGIAGVLVGIFSDIVYIIAGLCVAITAIVGIYETKKNKW